MNRETAPTAAALFDVAVEGDTVILTPLTDLRELAFQAITAEAAKLLEFVGRGPARNVIVDFGRTDIFGSSALGFFLQLWKTVRDRKGHMAFCNVSGHEKEILRVAGLASLWPLCGTREEAIQAVSGGSGDPASACRAESAH